MDKLTPTQRKALEIIRDFQVVRASQFSRLMWPDVERHLGKCGHGVTRGTGINLMAGGYLGKLKKMDLISGCGGGDHRYYLTPLGKEMLDNE